MTNRAFPLSKNTGSKTSGLLSQALRNVQGSNAPSNQQQDTLSLEEAIDQQFEMPWYRPFDRNTSDNNHSMKDQIYGTTKLSGYKDDEEPSLFSDHGIPINQIDNLINYPDPYYSTDKPESMGDNEALKAMELNNPNPNTNGAETQDGNFWNDATNVLAKNDWGRNYTGFDDFQRNGSYEQWKQFIEAPELAPYYTWINDEYGGFDNAWNQLSNTTIDQMRTDPALATTILGTDPRVASALADYIISNNGSYFINEDENKYRNYAGTMGLDDTSYAKALYQYDLASLLAQGMIDKGIDEEQYTDIVTSDAFNDLIGPFDSYRYITGTGDNSNPSLGTLTDLGKNSQDKMNMQYNPNAMALWGVPYAGLADTINRGSGGRVSAQKNPNSYLYYDEYHKRTEDESDSQEDKK